MKALVTGAGGFVGGYLCRELSENGYEVIECGRKSNPACDILDQESVFRQVQRTQPSVIFHLASQSSVRQSWQNAELTLDVNIKGAIHILEAVKQQQLPTRILLIGSAEQYGYCYGDRPLTEDLSLHPENPYAVSKCAQEMMGKAYADSYGMDIIMTRSFNQIGAGQEKGFVIPDFMYGMLAVQRGEKKALQVGNISVRRDFTDVRDAVRAYRLLAEKGKSGEVYNVGTGRSIQIRDLLEEIQCLFDSEIPVEVDASRIRPNEINCLRCDVSKLMECTHWRPEIPIKKTLRDIFDSIKRKEKSS